MLRPFCVGYTLYVSLSCLKSIQKSIKGVDFAELGVTPEEIEWLKKTCPFLKHDYIAYLSTFRLKPEQVSLEFKPKADDPSLGRIEITTTGLWVEAILWEVPLMACLSELYFLTSDRDWTYDGQEGVYMRCINYSDGIHKSSRASLREGCRPPPCGLSV